MMGKKVESLKKEIPLISNIIRFNQIFDFDYLSINGEFSILKQDILAQTKEPHITEFSNVNQVNVYATDYCSSEKFRNITSIQSISCKNNNTINDNLKYLQNISGSPVQIRTGVKDKVAFLIYLACSDIPETFFVVLD